MENILNEYVLAVLTMLNRRPMPKSGLYRTKPERKIVEELVEDRYIVLDGRVHTISPKGRKLQETLAAICREYGDGTYIRIANELEHDSA